jgi:recombination protein RecT
VLLLRDTPTGIEVLMTRRSTTASFAPGAYVFPGGGIDAADAQCHALATRRASQSDAQTTQAIAAIREAFEELGVVLSAPRLDPRTLDRHAPLPEQLAARGAKLDAASVYTFALWITDRDLPKRFEVPFLVARMPEGQEPVADESEQFEPVWVSPDDALQRHAAGQFFIIYPTIRTLERLRAYAKVDDVLAACACEAPLFESCPRAGLLRGEDARYMEHESPFGELECVSPDGQGGHALDWQTDRAVPLRRHIARLTAPNPSMMTGPGTNTYLIGTPARGFIVVDPGPNIAEHVAHIVAATHGFVHAIVCTHSHADHSPAARPLQAALRATGRDQVPIYGLPSAPTARESAHFEPDTSLSCALDLLLKKEQQMHTGRRQSANFSLKVSAFPGREESVLGFCIEATPDEPWPITWLALHTPGHAANHVCGFMLEDAMLLSGDHILNGSTTVIDPPDGDMAAYMNSLDRLSALCTQFGVRHILPAHGYVLGCTEHPAATHIAKLKAHRLQREARVRAAMAALPSGDIDDWLPLAYADVDARLWPVARRSLIAHVNALRESCPKLTSV